MATTASAPTPPPPYYAVIFTSQRTEDGEGYSETSDEMVRLAEQQDGYLGIESFRNEEGFGVTISYWRDLESMKSWKMQSDHLIAQREGRNRWYSHYKTRICRVERDNEFNAE
jgi:heme-degrading monooxygenase HmoA